MRILLAVLVLFLVLAGGAWLVAGRAAGPAILINQPARFVGQAGTLDVTIDTPRGDLTKLDAFIEQSGQRYPLFTLPGGAESTLKQESENRVHLTRPLGKRAVPQLRSGAARVVVDAERPVFFGLRRAATEAAHDVQVRLDPPRAAVLSQFHFINHGGSEVVVYRATPPEVESGVRVGDRTYPGFPATGAGVTGADAALKVAFFALAWDQDLNTPIVVYARDEAGNETTAPFEYKVTPKQYKKSNIEVSDTFLQRVVPAILQNTPDFQVDDPSDLVKSFLKVNGDLRRRNAQALVDLSKKTAPQVLWQGPFQQMSNSQVESSFADQRTYFYHGQEIDRQTHLGFDLAVTANVPVHASNRGVVAMADYFGIYGNTVVLDHGMGVQSLYAHLSSIDVKVGDTIEKDQPIGRSGMTGLAGGDHLHFTVLVDGQPVTPVDWWSKQWIEDRIMRKFRQAGAGAEATPAATK